MNPLEEGVVELLKSNKEEHGINALHYLEAFHTFSRVVAGVYEGKAEHLHKIVADMIEEGKDIGDIKNMREWGGHYLSRYEILSKIRDQIEVLKNDQSENNQLEELIQSERSSS